VAGGEFLGCAHVEDMGRAAVGLDLPLGKGCAIDTANAKASLHVSCAPARRLGSNHADRTQPVTKSGFEIEPGKTPALGPAGQ
jgi:hypothetical protein